MAKPNPKAIGAHSPPMLIIRILGFITGFIGAQLMLYCLTVVWFGYANPASYLIPEFIVGDEIYEVTLIRIILNLVVVAGPFLIVGLLCLLCIARNKPKTNAKKQVHGGSRTVPYRRRTAES